MTRSVVAVALLVGACGGGNGNADQRDSGLDAIDAVDAAAAIPVLRNVVDLPDLQLAQQATALLGVGGAKRCDRCHALTRERLRTWESETDAAEARCLTNLAPANATEAQTIIDCFRAEPGRPSSGWPPQSLGIYNTAARLDWFDYVFRIGFAGDAVAQHDAFVGEAAMPRGDITAFTQPEFDVVAEWFARGLPQLDAVVEADPTPQTCTTNITPDVAAHVTTMATLGWRARNRDAGILMFGCGAATGRGCLTDYPLPAANDFSTGWDEAFPAATLRVLRTNQYRSNYWTRSSADGRFVAHGGAAPGSPQNYSATIVDLSDDREIPARAMYDPGFFPDNSGFVIQSSNARFCEQSLLTTKPAMISFSEPQCRVTDAVGLYQHLGAVADGDYWTVAGQFDNDNGGRTNPTRVDTPATFDSSASVALTAMVHDGQQFVPYDQIEKDTPYEGDAVISPSASLLITRLDGPSSTSGTIGFVFRKVIVTRTGDTFSIDIPEIARYCVKGGKPALSYDERWMVFHHYVEAADWEALGYASATDPAFVALRNSGAANIFLMELTSGEVRRITTMQPGQYALYPHFRSDGWIYFIVRDRDRGGVEYIVASDAALYLETAGN